jgi:hypothetical protein
LSGNPKLDGLQDNGASSTIALQSGSAAINVGSHCGALPASDQRGNMHHRGATRYRGAYESGAPLDSNDEIFRDTFQADGVCP